MTDTLYAAKGGGSMIIEAAYALAKRPLKIIDLEWGDTGWASKSLKDLNPLGQVPTMVTESGEVMTESAAIILRLNDLEPMARLVPAPGHPTRNAFLRWLVFLASAVYPTFTYGDVTDRWVGNDPGAQKALRESTDAHRKQLYSFLETKAGSPWFLGDEFSALDTYLCAMEKWRPGPDWFKAECPKISAIAKATGALPPVATVLARQR
ncbi:MAG: glutathione S-transferase [Alphaproteobacteria bacterium]|nr:glutathione S-transferase [Alphaproteobacteria bacterium]